MTTKAGHARPSRPVHRRLVPGPRGESGQSMVIVIMAAFVLTLASIAVVNEGILQLPLAKHDVDYQKALDAAEAGVQDYINRLNQNPNYWVYSASNPPTPADPAFTGWEAIPGPAPNGSAEYFFYSVNSTNTPQTGMVQLSSSGLAGTTVRTITVGLRPASFLDNSYFTVYEMGDPTDPNLYPGQNSGSIVTNVTIPYCITESNVYNPKWGGYGPDFTSLPPQNVQCQPLYWATGETVTGPARSDDTFFICGSPNFAGPVTSAAWTSSNPGYIDMTNPILGYQQMSGCNSNPSFDGKPLSQGGSIASGAYLTMPSTNASLKSQADPSTGNGCLYTGQTTVTVSGTTMTVNSPNSTVGTAPGDTRASCLGTNVSLPANGVIYVQTAPSSFKGNCAASKNPSGKQWLLSDTPCAGDLFVQGSVNGQVTLASDNSVFLPGSLCLSNDSVCTGGGAPTSSDLLTGTSVIGVIANQFVEAYDPLPGQCASSVYVCSVPSNLTVDGAVLDLNHAFTVQNLSGSSPRLGTFTVNGAMSEYYPPLTGTSAGTGYAYTNNFYDSRLQTLSPPYFLDPVNSAWQRVSFAEGPPASGLPPLP